MGNQHFLLFPHFFSTLSKREIIILATFNMKSVNSLNLVKSRIWSFFKGLSLEFEALEEKPFENIVGKVENAGNQHFRLFPQCFLTYERQLKYYE